MNPARRGNWSGTLRYIPEYIAARSRARGAVLGLLWIFAGTVRVIGAPAAEAPAGLYADFETPRGTITCELYFEKAPMTVASFVGLAEGRLGPAPRHPFFNGLTFHRVVPGFVVQGGDPLGTGEGGPGYIFPDEFVPGLRHDAAGVLSMANSGPDTNGSQFFITLAAVPRLNYLHTVFGRMVAGQDVLAKIQQGDAMQVEIRRIGPAANAFHPDENRFAALTAKAPRATPAAFEDPSGLLQTEPPRAKTLNDKLQNFTRATGGKLLARMYDKFTPETGAADTTTWTDQFARSLQLPVTATLVIYFAAENTAELWSPSRPSLRLPAIQPWLPATPPSAATAPTGTGPSEAERAALDLKRRHLTAINELIDGLIYQLETPEKSETPAARR